MAKSCPPAPDRDDCSTFLPETGPKSLRRRLLTPTSSKTIRRKACPRRRPSPDQRPRDLDRRRARGQGHSRVNDFLLTEGGIEGRRLLSLTTRNRQNVAPQGVFFRPSGERNATRRARSGGGGGSRCGSELLPFPEVVHPRQFANNINHARGLLPHEGFRSGPLPRPNRSHKYVRPKPTGCLNEKEETNLSGEDGPLRGSSPPRESPLVQAQRHTQGFRGTRQERSWANPGLAGLRRFEFVQLPPVSREFPR